MDEYLPFIRAEDLIPGDTIVFMRNGQVLVQHEVHEVEIKDGAVQVLMNDGETYASFYRQDE